MDMESKTVEEQTTDTAERTDTEEKRDNDTLDPRLLQDDSSTHWTTVSPPVVLTKQGESSTEAQESVRAELHQSDEMEVSSDDTVVNDDKDFGAEIARISSGHNTLDDVADNTEDIDVNNTRVSGGHFSGGHYVLDDIADNTEELDADDAGDSIGHYNLDDIALPKCYHTEDTDFSIENDAHNTREASVTRFETSGWDRFNDLVNSRSDADAPQNFTPAKNNENPAEGRQIISVSPELNIDHTEEPDPAEEFEESPPNSNSTGTETEPSKESDEMSELTEVPTNSVASLNQANVEIEPFNFLGCPDKVRQRILRHVLHTEKIIKPYYNFGALELPAHKATRENYPTVVAAFAGHAELVDQTTTILYGENSFHLRHAKVALWWLKRIGAANVSKLKDLYVTLDEGVADHFGTRKETIWRHAFSLLHEHQQLYSLSVGFRGWTTQTSTEDGLSSEDSRVWGPRYAVLRMLLQWRGLGDAEVHPGAFVTEEDANVLVNALVMQPGETSGDIRKIEDLIKAPVGSKYSFA